MGLRTSTEGSYLYMPTSLSQYIFAAYFLKWYDIYEYIWIQLFIFRRKVIPDMYVLIVDGAVLTADMYAIKLIKWSKGGVFVSSNW